MISPTLLYRGTLTTSSATLVTTNGGGTTVVSSIVVANKTATASWFTLVVDGMYIAYQMPIAGNQTITLDVKQVVVGAKTITGLAGANSTVDVHISGNVQTGAQYVLNGNGSPEGVITANVGSEYIQQDDSQLGYLKWSKLSGTGILAGALILMVDGKRILLRYLDGLLALDRLLDDIHSMVS